MHSNCYRSMKPMRIWAVKMNPLLVKIILLKLKKQWWDSHIKLLVVVLGNEWHCTVTDQCDALLLYWLSTAEDNFKAAHHGLSVTKFTCAFSGCDECFYHAKQLTLHFTNQHNLSLSISSPTYYPNAPTIYCNSIPVIVCALVCNHFFLNRTATESKEFADWW